jgi:diguanylate cyclase (GGDEF)-like protein
MATGFFEQLRRAGRLPTPPGVVVQLLEMTNRDAVSAREIGDTIALDPPLAAKVLRFANSPLAGVRHEVTSLQRAVALLGIRGVNMTALSFAVLESGSDHPCPGFDRDHYCIQSIACGVASRQLAAESGVCDPQEAFVAGLLSQIGRSILAAGVSTQYAEVLRQARHVPVDLPPLEQKAFGESYASIGAQLLESWRIPETLSAAIGRIHELDSRDAPPPPLAKVIHVAEIAAGIICPKDTGDAPAIAGFTEAARRVLGIDDRTSCEVIRAVADETETMRAILHVTDGQLRDPEEIVAEVREGIAGLSIAMHLEQGCLAHDQEELHRRATTDALTGIANRADFDARFKLELDRSARTGEPLVLLLIDIDRFKECNDTYGHPAGDRVLQAVARTLDENVRKVDYTARYGGEEFAVLLPRADQTTAREIAERLRASVERLAVPWHEKQVKVTISVGAYVAAEARGAIDAEAIIEHADSLLYTSKRAGRNRVAIACDVGGKATPSAAATTRR